MCQFYGSALKRQPEVLTIKQISEFTGYGESSIVCWCNEQYLKNFFVKRRFYVPQKQSIYLLASGRFIDISIKSDSHRMIK